MVCENYSSGTKVSKLALNFYAKKYYFSFSFYYSPASGTVNSFQNRISNGIFGSAAFPPACAAGQQFRKTGCAVKSPNKQRCNWGNKTLTRTWGPRQELRACSITSRSKPPEMVPYRISFSEDQSTFLSGKRTPQSVTSNPKWPTVFLPSIGHTSTPSASSLGLEVRRKDLSQLHQAWQPSTPTKTERLCPLHSSCHIPPKYIIGRRPFFFCAELFLPQTFSSTLPSQSNFPAALLVPGPFGALKVLRLLPVCREYFEACCNSWLIWVLKDKHAYTW